MEGGRLRKASFSAEQKCSCLLLFADSNEAVAKVFVRHMSRAMR